MNLYTVTYTRRVLAENAAAALLEPLPAGCKPTETTDVRAIVFDFNGHIWVTDGMRIVRADVAPRAVQAARESLQDGGLNIEMLRSMLGAWGAAPAVPLPNDLVVPRGPGPWPSESEAVFTRALTELDGATFDIINGDPTLSYVARVFLDGVVVGYAAPQRARK